jgi:hypothetical protein
MQQPSLQTTPPLPLLPAVLLSKVLHGYQHHARRQLLHIAQASQL